ncbi:MAG TPA: SPOR domain-containing protein, partial [Dongiaceae bacterium]|nr:SPOR domain-containing protein [Dongiaceae bacterium]
RIQLISMPSEDAAWQAWKDLSGKFSAQLTGLTAIVQSADLGTKGTFYRVQAGPFDTVAKAQERCTTMKQAGLDCLVVGKP